MTRAQRAVVAALVLVFLFAALYVLGQLPQVEDNAGDQDSLVTRPASGGGTVGLFVEPDDGRAPILEELDAARDSITPQIYLLSDEEILSALERAEERGVEVRVIIEEEPFGGAGGGDDVVARLERAGVEVRWDNPAFRFTHIETFVIDRRTAIIMNLNLTKTSFPGNREFGVVTTRPADVVHAAAIFEADWRRTAEPDPGPLIVSPTTSRDELLSLIDGARSSLDIYAEVVRDQEIVAALASAEERGTDVRLLVSARSSEDRNDPRWRALEDAGIEVRFARGLYVHAKMVLADDARAYVGSQNFTATSLDDNRELGIILVDPPNLTRLQQTFEADFAKANQIAAS